MTACTTAGPPVEDVGQQDAGALDGASEAGRDGLLLEDQRAADLGPPPVRDRLIILHTNDLHDHLMGFGPNADYTPMAAGDDATVGGAARLAARVAFERQQAGGVPVLLLDGGDSLVGSLFTWLNPTKAPMYRVMQAIGYDATTFGNHEFEWSTPRLAETIRAAVDAGGGLSIVASNTMISATDPRDDGLQQAVDEGVISKKKVIALPNGLRVGVIGLIGATAASVAHGAAPVTFTDPVATARQLVAELRSGSGVDLVVVLSHGGVDDEGGGPDRELARAVPGIDVIISAHTHEELLPPVREGKTLIVQTGRYGAKLGKLSLAFDAGVPALHGYELIPLDDALAGDKTVQALVDDFIEDVDVLLEPYDLAYRHVVAETDFDLVRAAVAESTIGDLVTDAYRHGATAATPERPADLAFESNGVIRAEIERGKTGEIWFADLYRVMPMGVGKDGAAGYPLATFYLTGKEIGLWFELLPLARLLGQKNLFFQFSGAQVRHKVLGLPFDSIASVTLTESGERIDLGDSTKCYKVVSNVMVSEQLALAGTYSMGLLEIEPKESDCATKVPDLWQRVVDHDPTSPGLQELKHWQAIVDYLSQFPDTDGDGVPNVPQVYAAEQGRFVPQ